MDDKMLAPEQLIEVWRCCSMEFPGKDCGDCPVSIACKRLQGGDDAEEFYKRLFCQAAYHLHCEMSRKQQWVSVEDRLPEQSGSVLVAIATCDGGYLTPRMIPYSARHRAFNVFDFTDDTKTKMTNITH